MSHPAWVCGLKLFVDMFYRSTTESHPAWVCGLKLKHLFSLNFNLSHTLRGCVDWNWKHTVRFSTILVTPCVGVWIETNQVYGYPDYPGHTLRGCVDWNQQLGVSVMGRSGHTLRGCVDWNSDSNIDTLAVDSHTLRGCVDWNSWCDTVSVIWRSHTLRGCVDWNKNGLTTTIL